MKMKKINLQLFGERALGTKLKIDGTAVAKLTSISGIELSAETMDITTLDSTEGYREFMAGFIDGGEVTAEGLLSETGTAESELINKVGGDAQECTIEFPSGAKWEFDAIITAFSTDVSLEDPLSFSITLKVSGKPTFTTVEGGGGVGGEGGGGGGGEVGGEGGE